MYVCIFIPSAASVIVISKLFAPPTVTAVLGTKLSIATVKSWSPSSIASSIVEIIAQSDIGITAPSLNVIRYGPAP